MDAEPGNVEDPAELGEAGLNAAKLSLMSSY